MGIVALTFQNHVEDERPSECRMLIQENRAVRLCGATTRSGHPLCFQCYSQADAVTQEQALRWPPKRRGRETRLLHNRDDGYFGLLSVAEHNEYFHAAVPQPRARWAPTKTRRAPSTPVTPPTPPTFDFHAVEVEVGPTHPSWADGDARHRGLWTVYVLRLMDGSFYVGQTRKTAETRFQEHAAGTGARICREKGVEKLVFQTRTKSRKAAQEIEMYTVSSLRALGLRAAAGQDPDH